MKKLTLVHVSFLILAIFLGLIFYTYQYTFKWVIIDWFILTGFVTSAIAGWVVAVKKKYTRTVKTYYIIASFSPLIFIIVSACKSTMLGVVMLIYILFTFFGASGTLYSQGDYRIAQTPSGLSADTYTIYHMYNLLEREYGHFETENNPEDLIRLDIESDGIYLHYNNGLKEKKKFYKK